MKKLLAGTTVLAISLCGMALAAPQSARAAERPGRGPIFERFDPHRSVRQQVDGRLAARVLAALDQRAHRGSTRVDTALSALAATSAEWTALAREGLLGDAERPALARFTVLAVLETVAEHHPEVSIDVAERSSDFDVPSPVEEICNCDKRGSRACGCFIYISGGGECQYRVHCPGFSKALCSAVNAELCVARTVLDLL